mmetsp:Transcript_20668/g.61631  ORF Transcript_20668/g.61631 Transcript_20668/m.61631 type:complete len:487 (-) Transcript_20668:461-1921(-)
MRGGGRLLDTRRGESRLPTPAEARVSKRVEDFAGPRPPRALGRRLGPRVGGRRLERVERLPRKLGRRRALGAEGLGVKAGGWRPEAAEERRRRGRRRRLVVPPLARRRLGRLLRGRRPGVVRVLVVVVPVGALLLVLVVVVLAVVVDVRAKVVQRVRGRRVLEPLRGAVAGLAARAVAHAVPDEPAEAAAAEERRDQYEEDVGPVGDLLLLFFGFRGRRRLPGGRAHALAGEARRYPQPHLVRPDGDAVHEVPRRAGGRQVVHEGPQARVVRGVAVARARVHVDGHAHDGLVVVREAPARGHRDGGLGHGARAVHERARLGHGEAQRLEAQRLGREGVVARVLERHDEREARRARGRGRRRLRRRLVRVRRLEARGLVRGPVRGRPRVRGAVRRLVGRPRRRRVRGRLRRPGAHGGRRRRHARRPRRGGRVRGPVRRRRVRRPVRRRRARGSVGRRVRGRPERRRVRRPIRGPERRPRRGKGGGPR